MTAYVARNLAHNFPNVEKEVTDIMSGRILDYEAKDILNQGRREGIIALIRDNLEEKIPAERTIVKLQKYFHLTPSDARTYYLEYSR